MTREIESYPRYFTFEKALSEIKLIESPDLTMDDLILLVLGLVDKPINGRVVLHKEIFLLYNELKNFVKVTNPHFIRYKYGPYSPQLSSLVELLEDAGYIRVVNRRSTRASKYLLTDKGKKRAIQLILKLKNKFGNEFVERLIKLRIGWDQLGHDGILRYVYQRYPEYLEKSAKKDKYLHIDWGGLES